MSRHDGIAFCHGYAANDAVTTTSPHTDPTTVAEPTMMTPTSRVGSYPAALRKVGGLLWSALALAAVPGRGNAQEMPSPLRQFLQQSIGLTPDEIKSISTGTPVVKALDPADKREVAVFGIVSIDVPRSFYAKRASEFPGSLKNPARTKLALFSNPAVASDAAAFTLPSDDLNDLKNCKPGSCKVKMSSSTIADLQAHLDSTSKLADSTVNAYVRAQMARYVQEYRAQGNHALVQYSDMQSPVASAKVFDDMMSRSPYVYQYAPSLEKYLKNYPNDRPANIVETIFWAQEQASHIKPTLIIAHEMVYPPLELPGTTLIASKQLYADHYYDGALDLTAIIDRAITPQAAQNGIYVLVLHRLHFDDLPSGGLLNVKGKVIGNLRDQTKIALQTKKTESEQAYGKTQASSP